MANAIGKNPFKAFLFIVCYFLDYLTLLFYLPILQRTKRCPVYKVLQGRKFSIQLLCMSRK